jgi:hypothetical protein
MTKNFIEIIKNQFRENLDFLFWAACERPLFLEMFTFIGHGPTIYELLITNVNKIHPTVQAPAKRTYIQQYKRTSRLHWTRYFFIFGVGGENV